ncbi:MAG: metallophosphoesterase family protein [Solirubrobacterales bacterium]|nr:metallophosphoesterase family protein [Solirubrobacterales bacterium]MBV9837220.1 metallophosphoesterase family protein [Solirubrobacterales bacterium]
MLVAIVSDIHGNRHAFEAVLDAIERSECQEMWCLGDLVGYGAEPDACVELARRHAAICLAGNHDLGVIGTLPVEQFSRGAALAARWTREQISAETREYLERLEPSNLDESVGLYHASPRDPVWEYVLSPLQADLCLDVQRQRICLIGHSHVALSFSRPPGAPSTGQTRNPDEQLDLSTGEWLVNPGSVGQPRDGDPRAAWLELDTDGWSATYRRIEYDIAGAAAAIRTARLPDSLAERLSYGQ